MQRRFRVLGYLGIWVFSLCSVQAASDPIAATGWNTDFILGTNETHAAHQQPVNANIWFAENSTVGVPGLPASGAVTAAGRDFQFQPFSGGSNNCVRGDNVTLALVSPASFAEVSLLGSVPGSGSGTMVLQFSDASSTAAIPLSFISWTGSGDINPQLTGDGVSPAYNGGMIVFTYALSAADQSKTLESILIGGGGGKAIFAISGGPDETAPTLVGSDIVDERGGASIDQDHQVYYTVTFSEGINAGTVSVADFDNAGSATIRFGAVTELGPGVFSVAVTPTSAGTLQLQVAAGAVITDNSGNALVTSAAIPDDTTITVNAAAPDVTAPAPDPMSFSLAPYASSANAITMEASPALDPAGVAFYFAETSGNAGGDDSGWQNSRSYVDDGLTTGLQYTYTVTARDLSANPNTTAASAPASATAATPTNPPAVLTLTAPTSRHIVQRSTGNVGAIVISGTYSNSPDTIEARAVVMWGSQHSGTTTAWQTIDAAPSGGTFTGTLSAVAAGGWYQIEVRGVTGGISGGIVVQTRVGVGDIFVTAGQSNSANHSPGGYLPSDDRVSARDTTTGSTWVFAADPIPIASGGGGSVWPRLGDQLAATLDMPIGFIAVGVGGTAVSSWVPGAGNYNNRLKPAVQSLPINGFRAALWHQGETDTVGAGTSAADYASRLGSMMTQSRIDAGWDIPWYIAEASWHSNGPQNQERVVAGQRLAVHADPLAFLGETTDDMHLKGSPLHFDVPRQIERSQQYTEILAGTPALTPVNGHFEDNHDLAITGLSPLADGASDLVVITDNSTHRPLGWRILTASGIDAADGTNGIHNPAAAKYVDEAGITNHVALLDGGSAGNTFLHSTRALAEPNTTYTLTAAIGLRDNPSTFGDARLDILTNGAVAGSASFDKAALDALHGSDASGRFTDASVLWTTGASVGDNVSLAVRIAKPGGAGTVLDFDNVRFSTILAGPDTNAPDPNPMTFALAPALHSETSVVMTATTAVDVQSSPVQYYFTNTVNGAVRDWGAGTVWTQAGLLTGTNYGYRVKARDAVSNETAWSAIAYAVPLLLLDTNAPDPDPMTFAVVPSSLNASSLVMTATTAVDALSPPVQYFFTNTISGDVRDWMASTVWAQSGLLTGTNYGYRVKARDAVSNETAWSAVAYAAPSGQPSEIVVSNYIYEVGAPNRWPDTDGIELTDGLLPPDGATWDYVENVGFENASPQIRFDLGAIYDVTSVYVTHYVDRPSWTATNAWVSVSVDGITYSTPRSYPIPYLAGVVTLNFDVSAFASARYYRILFEHDGQWMWFSELDFFGVAAGTDFDPPEPDPMTFAVVPNGAGPTAVAMTAATAVDLRSTPVEYFFTNNVTGDVRGWDTSATWTNVGLITGDTYGYRVKARDAVGNETDWSAVANAQAGEETVPPQPDPMVFEEAPALHSIDSIVMTATTAVDVTSSPVSYFFTNTVNGDVSGWMLTRVWINSGLTAGLTNGYRVKARDAVSNETAWSAIATAVAGQETDPPLPDPMTFAVLPVSHPNRAMVMTATTAIDAVNPPVQYYFENTVSGDVSGWGGGATWTNTDLVYGSNYSFRVKARDAVSNETAWSAIATAWLDIAELSYTYGANAESQPQASGWGADIGNVELTDGVIATAWSANENVGFRNDSDNGNPQPRVIFDLGGPYTIAAIDIWSMGAFGNVDESVSISSSADGATFSAPVVVDPIVWSASGPGDATKISVDVSSLPAGQFFQVDVFDPNQWMMLSEIDFLPAPPAPRPTGIIFIVR